MDERTGVVKSFWLPISCDLSWDWKGWWITDCNGHKTTHLISAHKMGCKNGYVTYGVILVWLSVHVWSRNQRPNAAPKGGKDVR